MAAAKSNSGAIARAAEKQAETRALATNNGQPTSIQGWIKKYERQLVMALPKNIMSVERFTRLALSAVSSTPKLAECTPASFLGAMLQAAQLGLEPNTPLGQAYLIPYGGKCQFQLGYKGMLDLARRSGKVTSVAAYEVRENDTFNLTVGFEPKLEHTFGLPERGPVVGYYAFFQTVDGGYYVDYLSRRDAEVFARKYSKAYNSGPWKTAFDEMAKKTILKRVLKYAPLTSELALGVTADETIKSVSSDPDMAKDILLLPTEEDAEETNIVDTDYQVVAEEDGGAVDLATGEMLLDT